MAEHVFSIEKEYFRLVGQIYYTEDGAYKELPASITSSYIQVEVVYYIALATLSGEIRGKVFANTPAMDKNDDTGGDVSFGNDVLYTEAGAGSTSLSLSRNYNPYLTSTERSKFDALWANLVKTGAKVYG